MTYTSFGFAMVGALIALLYIMVKERRARERAAKRLYGRISYYLWLAKRDGR